MGSFGWASVLRAAAGLLYNHVLPCFHTSHGVCLHSTDSACKWRGKTVCEGAVTYEGKTSLQVCEPSGKLKFKKKELVKPGYPLAGRGFYCVTHTHHSRLLLTLHTSLVTLTEDLVSYVCGEDPLGP